MTSAKCIIHSCGLHMDRCLKRGMLMILCAVIGIGAISSEHVKGYLSQKERCRIVALSDVNESRAMQVNEQYGLGADIYSDYKTLLLDDRIQLVSVCTPPGLHCKIVLDCLSAGKNVLLEKPMAPSLEQCDRMLDAAARTGRLLSVVSQYRYTGQYFRLKKLLESGKAGKPLHIAVDALFWRGQPYYYLDWRGRWKTEGGGCTLNHAVHFIDQLLWLCGMPDKVAAFMGNLFHTNSEEEDISEAILYYGNGFIGRVTSSLIHHGEQQGIQIDTDRCRVGVPFYPSASKTLENGFPEDDPATVAEIKGLYNQIALPEFQGHAGQIYDVLDAIEGKLPCYTTGYDGRNALELILAIYKAASTQSVVFLPIRSDDPFYRLETMLACVPVFHEKSISVQGFQNNSIKVGGSEFIE